MAATYFQVIPLLSTRGRHVVCLFSPVLQTHQMADSLPSEPSGKPSNAPGCHHAQSWILQPIVPSPQKVPSPPPSPPLVQLYGTSSAVFPKPLWIWAFVFPRLSLGPFCVLICMCGRPSVSQPPSKTKWPIRFITQYLIGSSLLDLVEYAFLRLYIVNSVRQSISNNLVPHLNTHKHTHKYRFKEFSTVATRLRL